MPPLSLALWEIPEGMPDAPEGPAHLVRSIPWNNEPCDFLFRLVEIAPGQRIVFARPAGSQDEANWVLCDESLNVVVEGQAQRSDCIGDTDFVLDENKNCVEQMIESLLSHHQQLQLGRLVVLNVESQEKYALLIPAKPLWEHSKWLLQRSGWLERETLEMASHFALPTPTDFVWEGKFAPAWLNQQLTNPNSEISFSLRWSELHPNQRLELVCGGEENVAAIHDVMRWALQSQRALWEKYTNWRMSLLQRDVLIFSYDGGPYEEDTKKNFPLVYGVGLFLIKHHIQRLSSTLRERYLCTHYFPQTYPDDSPDPWTSIGLTSPPTAHERLEAALSLRQWLQANASPQEFEALEEHLDGQIKA